MSNKKLLFSWQNILFLLWCALMNTHLLFHQATETSERIDMEKLKAREQIMFFDDVLLFEDELHDHGVSMISVKIVSGTFRQELTLYDDIAPYVHLRDKHQRTCSCGGCKIRNKKKRQFSYSPTYVKCNF